MLKLKALLAALASVLLLSVGSARANFITSFINNNLENQIHDSSLETASTTTIAPGTIISGVVLYTQIGQTGNLHDIAPIFPNGEVTAIFSLKVDTVTPIPPALGGGNFLTFVPDPTFEATYGTGAMAAIYENDNGKPLTNQLAAGGGTIATYLADATAGTLNAVAGFTGAGGTATGGEGWTGTASNLTFPPTSGLTGGYNGNVDLLPSPTGSYAPNTLGTQTIFFKEPNPSIPGQFTQFALRGTQSFNPNFPTTSPFGVTDDSSVFYFANAVPEPSSCVLFGMGGMMLMFLRKRRNKPVA